MNEQLEQSCRNDLDIGILEADAVRLILEHRRERPVKLFRLDGRPHSAEVVVKPPHLAG